MAAVPSRKKLEIISVSWYLKYGQWKTVQGKENKDFGPDTRTVGESVDTKGFEGAGDH